MQLKPKNNVDFLTNGGCFLYYFEKDPKCLLTAALIEADSIHAFDSVHEKADFIKNDCEGNVLNCPYVNILWSIQEQQLKNIGNYIKEDNQIEEIEEEPEYIEYDKDDEDDEDENIIEASTEASDDGIPVLQFENATVDFDYSWPCEDEINYDLITDALIIPTDVEFNFQSFADVGPSNVAFIQNECKKRQPLFSVGECIVTNGGDTGYPKIIHGIITEHYSVQADLNNIGLAIYNSLLKADSEELQSVAIYPFIKLSSSFVMSNIDLYLKICLTTVNTLLEENELNSLSYILIHIPPDFISNLQDVIQEVHNVS